MDSNAPQNRGWMRMATLPARFTVTVSEARGSIVSYPVSALVILLSALLLAGGLAASDWTWPPDWRSHYVDNATGETWDVVPLDRYNLQVASDAKAVCVGDETGLNHLDLLPESVEHITFEVDVKPSAIRSLKRLPRLRSLDVNWPSVDEIHRLAELPGLKALGFGAFMLTEATAKELCRLKKLEALSFLGEVNAESINELAKNSSITRVSLDLYTWNDDIVRAISTWTSLEALSLSGGRPPIHFPGDPPLPFTGTDSDVSAAAWESLAKLKNLTEYRDDGLSVLTGSAVAKIVAGKYLTVFASHIPLSRDDFKTICSTSSLTSLSVSLASSCQTAEPLDIAKLLGKAAKLTVLKLFDVPRTWTGLSLLHTITALDISFVNHPEEELHERLAALPPNATILCLEHHRLTPGDISALALWSGARSCKALTLNARVKDASAFRQVLGSLARFEELSELNLDIRGPGMIGDTSPGVSQVAGADWKALAKLKNLTSLRLNVGEPGKLGDDIHVKRTQRDYYRLDREAVRNILNCPLLRNLEIRNQAFEPGALEDMRSSHLGAVFLDDARDLGAADIDAIAESHIETISLYCITTEITPEQAGKLVSAEGRKLVSLEGSVSESDSEIRKIVLGRETQCIVYAN